MTSEVTPSRCPAGLLSLQPNLQIKLEKYRMVCEHSNNITHFFPKNLKWFKYYLQTFKNNTNLFTFFSLKKIFYTFQWYGTCMMPWMEYHVIV